MLVKGATGGDKWADTSQDVLHLLRVFKENVEFSAGGTFTNMD